ncbi:testis-specific zinc finger protein topi [Musca vetustissima]|uniref:testis-specific zinc finger protein topi n=1 Tax=Musca vetustissima TaxID=27455 RepID=UPI002AB7D18C|nr:testis-specific zinc finger protein topi [Musca vetustissima]
MDPNDETFSAPDCAWLSEQFFVNQFRLFNPEYNERSSNDIFSSYETNTFLNPELGYSGLDVQNCDLTTTSQLTTCDFLSLANATNAGQSFEVKSEILDLSSQTTNGDIILPLSDANDEVVDETQQVLDCSQQALDLSVASQGQSVYLYQSIPHTSSVGHIKCTNCNGLFDVVAFQTHICANYINKNPIQTSLVPQSYPMVVPTTSSPIISTTSQAEHNTTEIYIPKENPTTSSADDPSDIVKFVIRKKPMLPTDPACIRLLNENQIRLRRFLKYELKYDVTTNAAFKMTSTKSYGNDTSSDTIYTSTSSALSSTTDAKKSDGPHDCTLCERSFVHSSGLLRHMEKHAMDLIPSSSGKGGVSQTITSLPNNSGLRLVIKCTLCGRILFEPRSALEHLYGHFPSTWMEEKELDICSDVPYEMYIDDALQFLKNEVCANPEQDITASDKTSKLLKMVILTCILQCEFCDFVFSDVSYLFVHTVCHSPERKFECFSCDICVRTTKEITNHWQTECVFMRENTKLHEIAVQRYFVCNVCENKFPTLDQLHEHRYTLYHFFPRLNHRLGILQIPCEYCDHVSENVQDCLAHYEDNHYKKHRKEKEGSVNPNRNRLYLCDICGKSYTQSSHLGQHLRFHQGVKPFACKEPGCSRKFTIRPDLNDHIRKCHTGERPYHCLVCDKRFLTGSVFYQHRLIHRGERRYECEDCGKRFYRADALKNHQRIHTGEKPFGCLFCTKNFRQRGDRDKHMRARHSHLDANARLMMQMQKLQLEAAAAKASNATTQQQSGGNPSSIERKISAVCGNHSVGENTATRLPLSEVEYPSTSNNVRNQDIDDIVMIGNVPFPKSMIESLMFDLDENDILKSVTK